MVQWTQDFILWLYMDGACTIEGMPTSYSGTFAKDPPRRGQPHNKGQLILLIMSTEVPQLRVLH